MKILLIYNENDPSVIDNIMPLLEKMKINSENFMVYAREWSSNTIKKQFSDFFKCMGIENGVQIPITEPSHAIILTPLSLRWLDFFAGFTYGAHFPFLVYGDKARIGTPEEFELFFASFRTEEALAQYLNAENIAIKRQEEAHKLTKARDMLMHMGIPVNTESLARCVEESLINEVKLFITAGFSLDVSNKIGVPLLNIAARKGNYEMFRLIFESGVNIDSISDDRGTTALFDSVMKNNTEIALDLVKKGAKLDVKSKDGQTALLLAAADSKIKLTGILLSAGADPDITDGMGMSARKYAALFKNQEVLKLFDLYAKKTEA
jgi:hypothetical protein